MEDFNYDSTFDWVDKCEEPEVQEDGLKLLRVMDLFDDFPSNLFNAKNKRLDTLKYYKQLVLEINITNPTVAHEASQWLTRLDGLIWIGEHYGSNKWYQKEIRNRIKKIKKYKEKAFDEIANQSYYWYSMSVNEMLEPWRK